MALNRSVVVLLLLLGPALGFVVGRWTAPAPAEPTPALAPASRAAEPIPDASARRAEPPVAAPAPGLLVVDRTVLRQEIQQTLREELAAFRQQTAAAQAAEKEKPAP